MPRFRVLVALCVGLSLLAPAAVAAGVWVHLQWAEHYGVYAHHAHGSHGNGGARHDHEGYEPGAGIASIPVDGQGVLGTHSHEVPEPAEALAAFRHERPRAGAPTGGTGLGASGTRQALPPVREPRSRPPDPGSGPPSGPPRIHLHCALLI